MLGCDCTEQGGTGCSKALDGVPIGCSAKNLKVGAFQPKVVNPERTRLLVEKSEKNGKREL